MVWIWGQKDRYSQGYWKGDRRGRARVIWAEEIRHAINVTKAIKEQADRQALRQAGDTERRIYRKKVGYRQAGRMSQSRRKARFLG